MADGEERDGVARDPNAREPARCACAVEADIGLEEDVLLGVAVVARDRVGRAVDETKTLLAFEVRAAEEGVVVVVVEEAKTDPRGFRKDG